MHLGTGSRLEDVIVCDIDKDNHSDLIVTNYGTNSIGILLGYGNGSFDKQRIFSTGPNSHPSSIAIGDFNKGDQIDIVIANSGTQNINMLLGDGKGMFALQSNDATMFNFTPYTVAAGDLNNDGQSEIVVAYSDGERVDIYAEYDRGMLADQTTYSTGEIPLSVATGDFNLDTHLDIVTVSNYRIEIFLGYGNGSFANQIIHVTDRRPFYVAVGDFNNDNRLDIVVAYTYAGSISVLLGYGNGFFTNETAYVVGRDPSFLIVEDFNNDNNFGYRRRQ